MTTIIKGLQIISVSPVPQETVWEHGILWSGISSIEIALADAHWYGIGALRNHHMPLERLSIPECRMVTEDPNLPGYGSSGLLGILDPFWINSAGAGVYVESDTFSFAFNPPIDRAKLPKGTPPALADGVATEKVLRITGENLTIRFYSCKDARDVVEKYYARLDLAPIPPRALFEKPLWTTWANFKNDINNEKVLDFAAKIKKHGFTCSVFGIDAKWQKEFGDTRFDPEKFPEPPALIKKLHELGYEVTLWCVPFFNKTSEHFENSIKAGVVLRNTKDDSTYIGKWWEGEAAFLDLSNPKAIDWHMSNLRHLAEEIGLDGFKFDAGEAAFYLSPDVKPSRRLSPAGVTQAYVGEVSKRYPWSDARATWRTQNLKVLVRQWDKITGWGYDNGLASCIAQTITLNLLGYRYNFSDMIGGNEYLNERGDFELMIRWTQAVTPMPFIQFSVPPWRFGRECAKICAGYNRLHAEFADLYEGLAKEKAPLVRPLWWTNPTDKVALRSEDQYLVGNNILVAPVITPDTVARDVYLPEGKWQSYWDESEVHDGGKWLKKYPAPLETLPLFKRFNKK